MHQNAIDYFQYFLENKIEIYLSTIVISEYSVKDDINNLPLKTMKIAPFDFFDGIIAGEFHSILLNNRDQLKSLDRTIVKDDCKLIAQIYNRKIDAYITKDRRSFRQIINPIIKAKNFSIELLDLDINFKAFQNLLF